MVIEETTSPSKSFEPRDNIVVMMEYTAESVAGLKLQQGWDEQIADKGLRVGSKATSLYSWWGGLNRTDQCTVLIGSTFLTGHKEKGV